MSKRLMMSAGLCLMMMLSGVHAYAAAGDEAQAQQNVYEAIGCGVVFHIPDEYMEAMGNIEFADLGDVYTRGEGIVQMTATYTPIAEPEFNQLMEKADKAEDDGDLDTALEIIMQLNTQNLFSIYGINDGRGKDELIEYLLSQLSPEKLKELGYVPPEEEIEARKEAILSQCYSEIGANDGFTYILVTDDPETLRTSVSFPEGKEDFLEEYLSLVENTDLITQNVTLTGGVELRDPIVYTGEGTGIQFETTDLDGNPVKSEDLFAGHSLTMINLWGTWCGPCKRELPELEEMNREFAEKGCQIIGIVTDAVNEDKISEAKEILKEKGVTYVNLTAFEGLSELLPQEAYPTSYFVDENGHVVGDPVVGAYLEQYRERLTEGAAK